MKYEMLSVEEKKMVQEFKTLLEMKADAPVVMKETDRGLGFIVQTGEKIVPVMYWEQLKTIVEERGNESAVDLYLKVLSELCSVDNDNLQKLSDIEYIKTHVHKGVRGSVTGNVYAKDLYGYKTFCYVNISDDEQQMNVKITSDMVRNMNIDPLELFTWARTNDFEDRKIVSLSEMFGFGLPEFPAYIVTNQSGVNGAGVIMNSKVLDEVFKMFGEGFLILPSSIHEVICVPLSKASPGIVDVVKDINSSVVQEQDLLGDTVLKFDGDNLTVYGGEE